MSTVILHCLKADLGRHVVGDAEGQVLLDALHAVAVLLLGGAEVLLQGARHGGEDGLGCLAGVHHVARGFLLLLLLHALDVGEGLFYRHHQSGRVQAMFKYFYIKYIYIQSALKRNV